MLTEIGTLPTVIIATLAVIFGASLVLGTATRKVRVSEVALSVCALSSAACLACVVAAIMLANPR